MKKYECTCFCDKYGTSLFYHSLSSDDYFASQVIINGLPKKKVQFVEEIFYDNKPCYYAFANDTTKKKEIYFQ